MATRSKRLVPVRAIHPGEVLREELRERGIKQKEFAQMIGVAPTHLNEFINGKRNLNENLAIKLEQALGISYKNWMNLHNGYVYDCKNIENRQNAETHTPVCGEMKAQLFKEHYSMKTGTGGDVQLSVILYEEDGVHYAYCAALDILGYGKTEAEAKQSFKTMVKEVITKSVANGTLSTMLRSYGWNKNQEPPKITDLISSNTELADIINNKAYKTIFKAVHIPC